MLTSEEEACLHRREENNSLEEENDRITWGDEVKISL